MRILGTKVHNITLPQALKRAEGFWDDGKQHYIVTANPEIVLHAQRDAKYRSILNNSDLSLPDGVGLVWASRILYGRRKSLKARITGVDFMYEFLRSSHASRALFIGGKNGVARRSAFALKKKMPHLDFHALENTESAHMDFLVNEIIQPNCIFVGLGAPKQEKWIHENLARFPAVKIAMGVGGSFDFISGRVPRAPLVFQKAGMEWIWRLLVQPWRLKRIIHAAIIFPALVLRAKYLSTIAKLTFVV